VKYNINVVWKNVQTRNDATNVNRDGFYVIFSRITQLTKHSSKKSSYDIKSNLFLIIINIILSRHLNAGKLLIILKHITSNISVFIVSENHALTTTTRNFTVNGRRYTIRDDVRLKGRATLLRKHIYMTEGLLLYKSSW
jgi:hypothetical protein